MKKSNENFLSMLKTLLLVLSRFASIVSLVPEFAALRTNLQTRVQNIENLIRLIEMSAKGITIDKKVMKKMMAQGLSVASSLLSAYAYKNSDNELKEYVHYSESNLYKMRDELLNEVAANILAKASEHSAELVNYGLDATTLAQATSMLNLYSDITQKPRDMKVDVSGNRIMLERLIKDTHSMLVNSMDKCADLFKITNPEFYVQYKIARKIVHSGTTKHKSSEDNVEQTTGAINLNVNAAVTMLPLLNVLIEIPASEITDYTDEDGNFFCDMLAPGTYIIILNLETYQTNELTVLVKAGETTEVDALMEKETV